MLIGPHAPHSPKWLDAERSRCNFDLTLYMLWEAKSLVYYMFGPLQCPAVASVFAALYSGQCVPEQRTTLATALTWGSDLGL